MSVLDFDVKLPEGSVAIEAVILVKFLDNEGVIRYGEILTNGLHPTEALGMLCTAEDSVRAFLMRK